MNLNLNHWKRAAVVTVLASQILTGSAADNPPAALLQRPAWLSELSVGVKENYDDNVFLSGVDTPPPYILPAGSVAALKNRSSWITTVSPKVDANFAPFFGDQKALQVLSLGYAPDFVVFHDQGSESYDAHRFLTTIKAKTDSVSITADDTFTYVDGSNVGPVYPGGYLSAFATVADRDRREQILDKGSIAIQFNREQWFFRPCAALLYQDMMTEKLNLPAASGYQNYADRYDVNGGADLGYKMTPQLAVTLGYRYGHQYQEQFSFTPYSSPSDYQRVLLGLEGSPWKWLEVKIQGGPDFRNYEADSATHITPVNDFNPIDYYGEALLTAKVTPKDTLVFKYKQWQWVSTLGKAPYFDSTYDLSYHRKLTDKLGLDLGGRLLSWDFTSGNLSTCNRNDLEYTASAGLAYAINAHLSVNVGCTFDWGRNAADDVNNPQNREFDHSLLTLGTQCKF